MNKLIILFGSRANHYARKGSDFDIAFLGSGQMTLTKKIVLKEKLSNTLKINEDKIDLIDLWEASPLLQWQVATTGRLLLGKKQDFEKFQIMAFKRYQNTAKFRRVREKLMKKIYAK